MNFCHSVGDMSFTAQNGDFFVSCNNLIFSYNSNNFVDKELEISTCNSVWIVNVLSF